MATAQARNLIDHLRRLAVGGCDRSDGQLLESFLSQCDQSAFEVIVQRHGAMVLGVCRRVLNNSHDAEDAFQATFLVLVRKASSLLSRQTIGDWLYGVAYHTALKARAAALRRRTKEREVADMAHPKPLDDIWAELRPRLDQELNRLPEKYRAPVVLCDLEGKTRVQAAQQLGWPEGTVSGRLSRARIMLAQRLTRRAMVVSGGSLAAVLAQNAASACVSAPLALSTAKAATLVAAGQAAASGLISAQVAALTEGVLKTMFMTKLKIATTLVLTVGMLGSGAGVLTWTTTAAEKSQGEQVVKEDGQQNQKDDGQKNQKDDGQRRREGQNEGQGQLRREGQGAPRLLPPGIERLELTDAQKEKVAKLEKEFQEKLDTLKKKLDEGIEQAKQAQDRRKAEEAQQEFRKEVGKLHEELFGQLQQVLTDEQKGRLAELQRRQQDGARPGSELLRLLGQLDLSAEQKEKVEKLVKEVNEKQEAMQKKLQEGVEQAKQNQDREKVQELFKAHQQEMAKLHEELHGKVVALLTDEQKQKLGEAQRRRGDGPPGSGFGHVLPPPLQEHLGLTQEQREKIAKLQQEVESKLKEILNEEQNRKLEDLKKGGRGERRRE